MGHAIAEVFAGDGRTGRRYRGQYNAIAGRAWGKAAYQHGGGVYFTDGCRVQPNSAGGICASQKTEAFEQIAHVPVSQRRPQRIADKNRCEQPYEQTITDHGWNASAIILRGARSIADLARSANRIGEWVALLRPEEISERKSLVARGRD